ncbi:MmcQ/YjbR family DNA-binding protein, partial [Mycobacterium tuberculosis]
YGTPALFVGKKLLVRLKEDGADLVLRVGFEEKTHLMSADPDTFYETDHYRGYPAVLARLARLDAEVLMAVVIRQWRASATKTLLKAHPEVGA